MNMFLHPIRKNYSNNNKKAEGSSSSEFAFCFLCLSEEMFSILHFVISLSLDKRCTQEIQVRVKASRIASVTFHSQAQCSVSCE